MPTWHLGNFSNSGRTCARSFLLIATCDLRLSFELLALIGAIELVQLFWSPNRCMVWDGWRFRTFVRPGWARFNRALTIEQAKPGALFVMRSGHILRPMCILRFRRVIVICIAL
jgi:hypothetical protein